MNQDRKTRSNFELAVGQDTPPLINERIIKRELEIQHKIDQLKKQTLAADIFIPNPLTLKSTPITSDLTNRVAETTTSLPKEYFTSSSSISNDTSESKSWYQEVKRRSQAKKGF